MGVKLKTEADMDRRDEQLEFLQRHSSNWSTEASDEPLPAPAPAPARKFTLLKDIGPALARAFGPVIKELQAENAELRSRLDALEAKMQGPNLRRVV